MGKEDPKWVLFTKTKLQAINTQNYTRKCLHDLFGEAEEIEQEEGEFKRKNRLLFAKMLSDP